MELLFMAGLSEEVANQVQREFDIHYSHLLLKTKKFEPVIIPLGTQVLMSEGIKGLIVAQSKDFKVCIIAYEVGVWIVNVYPSQEVGFEMMMRQRLTANN